jgi:hypothetical protein
MAEINAMVNRAVRLEFPDLTVPAPVRAVTPAQIYSIQRRILVHSTKLLCPLIESMRQETGKLNYIEFIRAMDGLNLEEVKLAIMREEGFPDCPEERMVEFFNKHDEACRIQDQDFMARMTALEKVYEGIMEVGLKEEGQPAMGEAWIEEQYSAV